MSSAVLKTLTGQSNCKLNNEKDLLSKKPSNYTATISGATKVYSICPGTVLFLGYYKGLCTVAVSAANHEVVRYINLTNVQVWNQSSIEKGQYLGDLDPKTNLQFEYCTQWKGQSSFPIRIDNNLYYKQNPLDLLTGKYTIDKELDIQTGLTLPVNTVKLTEDQSKEWSPAIVGLSEDDIDKTAFQITSQNNVPQSALDMLSNNGGAY